MHEAAYPQTVLWDNPEGWGMGREVGRVSGWGDTCILVADSC